MTIYDVNYYVCKKDKPGSVIKVIEEGLSHPDLQQIIDGMEQGKVVRLVITAWQVKEGK